MEQSFLQLRALGTSSLCQGFRNLAMTVTELKGLGTQSRKQDMHKLQE